MQRHIAIDRVAHTHATDRGDSLKLGSCDVHILCRRAETDRLPFLGSMNAESRSAGLQTTTQVQVPAGDADVSVVTVHCL